MRRVDSRDCEELRKVNIIRNYLKHPQGSVLMEMGETKVICTAMIEEKVPHFLKGSNKGWITAEYSMLPGSTIHRKIRDSSKGRIEGRTQEIQRLIGRALRSVVDLNVIGERTIWIDCDVIQADGGTRTASITGAFVALVDALHILYTQNQIPYIPISNFVSAVSVGIVDGKALLDLCYEEDYKAQVDMNIVMTGSNEFVEIQGTGEESTFSMQELKKLLYLGKIGNEKLIEKQKEALGDLTKLVGKKSKDEDENVNE